MLNNPFEFDFEHRPEISGPYYVCDSKITTCSYFSVSPQIIHK
jgi:hypothetical protein